MIRLVVTVLTLAMVAGYNQDISFPSTQSGVYQQVQPLPQTPIYPRTPSVSVPTYNVQPNISPYNVGTLPVAPQPQYQYQQNANSGASVVSGYTGVQRSPISTTTAQRPSLQEALDIEYAREFAWNLFKLSRTQVAYANLLLSPIQVQLILSLFRTGAAGTTEQQIRDALQERNPRLFRDLIAAMRQFTSPYNDFQVANAVFVANDLRLNSSFVQESQYRDVQIFKINFDSFEDSSYYINNWIRQATKGRIQQLFKPDAARGARLLLATTMYFNGQWKYAFNETFLGRFETARNYVKNVHMMKSTMTIRSGDLVGRNAYDTGRWIELPYAGNEFAMIIIIPNRRLALEELLNNLDAYQITSIFKQLDSSYKKKVFLEMPKFNIGSTYSLVSTLNQLNVVDLFSQQSCRLPYFADSSSNFVRVDDIIQQSTMTVDERGTVASVATISHVVTLSLSSAPEEIVFHVDQPFITIIVDKRNKMPLFIGKVYNP